MLMRGPCHHASVETARDTTVCRAATCAASRVYAITPYLTFSLSIYTRCRISCPFRPRQRLIKTPVRRFCSRNRTCARRVSRRTISASPALSLAFEYFRLPRVAALAAAYAEGVAHGPVR